MSYGPDLRGPSIALDTACSPSLTALLDLAPEQIRVLETRLGLKLYASELAGRGSIVVYAYPDRACVECRTLRARQGSGEEIIGLPPGRYMLALRYYDYHPERLCGSPPGGRNVAPSAIWPWCSADTSCIPPASP